MTERAMLVDLELDAGWHLRSYLVARDNETPEVRYVVERGDVVRNIESADVVALATMEQAKTTRSRG